LSPRSRRRSSVLGRLYWDATCFIALFNKEPTTPAHVLRALADTYDEMLAGRVVLGTADIAKAEVFKDSDATALDALVACPHFDLLAVRTPVSTLAGQLRKKCLEARTRRSLKTPDAIHLATAALSRFDEFWTTDAKLVKLFDDGLLEGVPPVRRPYVLQPKLPFPQPNS
jgi:predicted nucleic acid-binding protein